MINIANTIAAAVIAASPVDSTDIITIEPQVVRPESTKVEKVATEPMYGLARLNFGTDHKFGFDFGLGVDSKISDEFFVRSLGILSTNSTDNSGGAKVQALTELIHPSIEGGINLSYTKGNENAVDSSLSSRIYTKTLPNGQEIYAIQERQDEQNESDNVGTRIGLRANVKSKGAQWGFCYAHEGIKETTEKTLSSNYNENMRRVTDEQQGSGLWVRERANINTNVLTDITDLLEINKSTNNFLIQGVNSWKNLELLIAANMNNNGINTLDELRTRTRTNVNGVDTVIVEGNGMSDTIIVPIYAQDDQTNRLVTRDFVAVKTDYLEALLRYGNPNKTNGVLDLKQGFFEENGSPHMWHIGNRLNFPIANRMFNSLEAFIGENVTGFDGRLGIAFIPHELIKAYDPQANLTRYYNALKDISRRNDLSGEQKEILSRKALRQYAKNDYGLGILFGFSKIHDQPNRVMWNAGIDYNALDVFSGSLVYSHDTYQNQNGISASATIKDKFDVGLGYKHSVVGNNESKNEYKIEAGYNF